MDFVYLNMDLRGYGGHGYAYAKALEEAVGAERFDAAVSRECALDVPWMKVFGLGNFRERVRDLRGLFGKGRFFFVDSMRLVEWLALSWSVFWYAGSGDRICVIYRYGRDDLRFRGWGTIVCGWILRMRLGKGFSRVTDSELVARQWGKMGVLPIPHTGIKGERRVGPLRAVWPGVPRESKGKRFIDQIGRDLDGEFELVLSDGPLSSEEYHQLLIDADIALLPYDPKVYGYGTSGILVEAIITDCMPFVRAGSWLAHELSRHNLRELIIDWDDPIPSITQAFNNQEVRRKLSLMKEEYSAFHNPKTFRQELLRHANF